MQLLSVTHLFLLNRLIFSSPYICFIKSARVGDPHTHEIAQVQPNDQGTYTCVVGNGKNKSHTVARSLF